MKQQIVDFNQDLMAFLASSPTPFHAVAEMSRRLQAAGFQELKEASSWAMQSGGRYFATRNDSSIVAFKVGQCSPVEGGVRLLGAHTDSPCLKVKPNPEKSDMGYFQLGVEVYGGVLLNPWFDRDLSLAGRVTYRDTAGAMKSGLVNFVDPVAVIPSLAIHLDREANKSRTVNPQTDIPPILMKGGEEAVDFRQLLVEQLRQQSPECGVETVLDYDLVFYDTQPPALVGLQQEFLASARLDNLLSCYVGLQALIESGDEQSVMLVCNDHEEVGSRSAAGAQGTLLSSVLERLSGGGEAMRRMIEQSMLISADNAHGIHPNYPDRHDQSHGPMLNAGPVIKINANQSYATTSETAALFRHLCESENVPVQSFVVSTDMGCGSTIGPLTSSLLGVKTVDVGAPQFAMHSIRELAGTHDSYYLYRAMRAFAELTSVQVG